MCPFFERKVPFFILYGLCNPRHTFEVLPRPLLVIINRADINWGVWEPDFANTWAWSMGVADQKS
jgi:hypothetical protein